MDWIEFALAMTAFALSHRIPAVPGLRSGLVRRIGLRGYVALFSALSVGLLVWLIVAAGRAPFVPLWDQVPWHRWAVNIAMPVAIVLAVLGTGAPNPFAFEGRSAGFDPDRPGIAGLTRQPLLWALALWSGAHLLVNGDLAHVLLFGPFLLMALLGMPLVERRRRRAMAGDWDRLAAHTGLVPFAALATGRWRPGGRPPVARLVLAAVVWAVVWHLHGAVIGVSALP